MTASTGTISTLAVTSSATVGGALGVTGDTTLGGALTAGAATLSGLSVANNAMIGGTLGVTGNATIGGTLTGGDTTLNSLAVTANTNLGGALTAGATTLNSLTVSNNAAVHGTFIATGPSSFTGDMSGGNATFSGTVTAANFSGSVGGTTINWGSAVVPLANGGTGYAASSTLDLLGYLGGTNAGNLNTGTLDTARIAAGSITSALMAPPGGVVGGPYFGVFVDSAGRVAGGSSSVPSSSAINDGSGESVTASGSGIVFTTSNLPRAIINLAGLVGYRHNIAGDVA